MNTENRKKKEFVSPAARIFLFEAADIITTSGGFEGEWDLYIPEER